MPHSRDTQPPEAPYRSRLAALVSRIPPVDAQEAAHITDTLRWIASGAPLTRRSKPADPPTHLVSYFVAIDEQHRTLLLVAHRGAGLWLPAGGHVEPAESPWDTVVRECREELTITATPHPALGPHPMFLTVTETRGPGQHTDVSLWYLLQATANDITSYDTREFTAVRWLTPQQVLAEPVDTLDPHMHRFTRKLITAIPTLTAPRQSSRTVTPS